MPGTAQIHPAHADNIARKAERLARWIHANLTTDPTVVAQFTDTDWANVADVMGERRTPSELTRSMTLPLIRALNTRRVVVPAVDPFEGLPS